MAVRIRLKRTGRRNRPFYRICVFDSRTRRDGAPIEELGTYDPRAETFEEKVTLRKVRAHHWLGVGALPTETVASIVRKSGVFKDGPVPTDDVPAPAEAAAAAAAGEPAPEAGKSSEPAGES